MKMNIKLDMKILEMVKIFFEQWLDELFEAA
jgi:hypothetical protein